LPILILVLAGPVFGALCPPADLTEDCKVDLSDVKVLAEQWLNPESCEEDGPCADFVSPYGIDFIDFSFLGNYWQAHGNIPLVINEFMASNNSDSDINDPYGDYDDWIEIYNYGDVSIDLAGMYLTDNLGNPTKWQVPSGYPEQTTVPPDGFVVFWADEEPTEGPLHTTFKLSAGGEEIGLFDTDGNTPVDTIVFGEQTTNISYGRYPDANNNWRFFPTPTPLADNNGAYLGVIEQVEFSHTRGFCDTSFNLTLACVTSGVNIYYTTDGRSPIVGEMPAPTSIQYMTPIAVNSTKYIRAAAIKTGWMPSRTETHTYIFGASAPVKSMPAMAIVGDPTESLWAPNGVMAHPTGTGILWEKPISLEVINNLAGTDYQIDCGIRVHGNQRSDYTIGDDWLTCTSNDWNSNLNWNKFSFRFYFRSIYGDNRFDFPLFPYEPEGEKKQAIVLRGGKNDGCVPFIRDEWVRRLFRKMGGVQITGALVNLYINGVYKAYYNPCNRDNSQFFEEWYGTDNEFDVITNSGIRDGDSIAWDSFLNFIDTYDLADTNNYEYVAGKFDITHFIDYLIVQIYSSNFDWPNNNWTLHHERSDDSKFRFTIWDAEGIETWFLGLSCERCYLMAFEDCPSYDPQGLNNGPWPICRIYRALKANPNFRQLFADRIHKHFNNYGTLTQDNLNALWSQTFSEVSPVLYSTTVLQAIFIPELFIPVRRAYVLAAFEENSLFDLSLGAPVFYVNSVYKYGGYVSTSDTFTITDPCSSGGTIYYTTDGSDPRTPATRYSYTTPTLTFVLDNANKKVLVPGSDIGTTWRGGSEPYDDSSWTSGSGGVGYERSSGYDPYIGIDVETAMYNKNGTCYIRIPFTIDANNLDDINSLVLRMRYDDGFVAYINGTEVKRAYAPTTPVWNSLATTSREASSAFESFDISSYISALHAGTNILAIHGLNGTSTTSTDFLISTELEAPGETTIFSETDANVSPTAIQYTGGFTINKSTNLKSRIYKSGAKEWSALNEAVYTLANVGQNLRITEIMYNPKDTGEPNDEDTEYIELKNIGASTINLNLARFTKGVDFTFGPNTLAAGQYILVVKDINAFTTKYGTGRPIAGQYDGSLDNAGEKIRLKDANGTNILDFDYKDGWRSIADGEGYSLTIINPANSDVNSWKYNDSWRASAYINGSPGWDDSGIIPNPGSIAINEVMSHSHAVASDWIELRNTTASAINIGGWYLSDSDSNLMKYRFATGTTIPANGYMVVREDVNFGDAASDTGKLIPFALSENGEMVCLTSALDANSNLTGYREKEDFGASETGVSYGRYYKASTSSYNFVPMDHNTLGTANAYPKVGPIVITEIMYHPDWPAGGNYANDEYEYIELRNTSGSSVTLYDSVEDAPWKFTNGIDYTFGSPPSAVTIAAGARILVVKNPTAFNWRYPGLSGITYGPYSGWLANEGEQLELGKPGDIDEFGVRQYIRVERINYSDGSHPGDDPNDLWPTQADGQGKSLTRTNNTAYGNDPNNWTAATPTPGS
jgi:hypothetical protein